MNKTMKSLFFVGTLLLTASCANNESQVTEASQNEMLNENNKMVSSGDIEVIQFHSEHRCMTCSKIEANTIESLKNIEGVSFRLVNVDDVQNEVESEQFEATGTALFLHNIKTGVKKELTDFAFMNAQDEKNYILKLRAEIDQFDGLR